MKMNIYLPGIASTKQDKAKTLIKERIKHHMEPYLTNTGGSNSEIAVVATKQADGAGEWEIRLRTYLPPKAFLVAQSQADKLEHAIEAALANLLEKVESHIARVRRQESSKRRSRRSRLKKLKKQQDALSSGSVNDARSMIDKLLPKLKRAVKRELTFLRRQGDLRPIIRQFRM